jgi:hypothetical protein
VRTLLCEQDSAWYWRGIHTLVPLWCKGVEVDGVKPSLFIVYNFHDLGINIYWEKIGFITSWVTLIIGQVFKNGARMCGTCKCEFMVSEKMGFSKPSCTAYSTVQNHNIMQWYFIDICGIFCRPWTTTPHETAPSFTTQHKKCEVYFGCMNSLNVAGHKIPT